MECSRLYLENPYFVVQDISDSSVSYKQGGLRRSCTSNMVVQERTCFSSGMCSSRAKDVWLWRCLRNWAHASPIPWHAFVDVLCITTCLLADMLQIPRVIYLSHAWLRYGPVTSKPANTLGRGRRSFLPSPESTENHWFSAGAPGMARSYLPPTGIASGDPSQHLSRPHLLPCHISLDASMLSSPLLPNRLNQESHTRRPIFLCHPPPIIPWLWLSECLLTPLQ